MESANIHHHHHQQVVAFSSSSSSPPNCYGVGSATAHTWRKSPTSSILNTNGHNISYPNPQSNLRPGEQSPQHDIQLTSLYMAPNSGLHWGANTTAGLSLTTTNHQSSPQEYLQLSRIKDVFSDHYDHLKYTELLGTTLNPSSITHHEFSLMRNQQTNLQSDDIGPKFLLKPFSSGNLTNKIDQHSPGDLSFSSRTGFSQIFPGANLSDFSQETNPGSLDMNLQAVDDLLSSSRFSGNFSPAASYGLDHMHQPYQIPLYSSNKMSSDGAAEAKRSSCSKLMEAKALQTAPKKSRVEARASCPPFKVRKEKLGDRVAALQQLVAPFGKTDTASVLMEAIGYIKFLQNQVETLSLPYMNNTSTNIHTTTTIKAQAGGIDQNESEETKHDLRSRGLCLVPLSCMAYITDGGAVLWPPPHFGGAAT